MGGIRNMARFKSLADQADSQEAICDYMYYILEIYVTY